MNTINDLKIAIYGAGSLGTILGAYISKANVKVDLINRNRNHIKALKEKGATVTGTVNFNVKVNALYIEEMKDKYDVIFLMTKQQDNENVAKFLKDYLTSEGVVVTLQNGLPEYLLQDILTEEKVLGCTVAWGATLKEPGVSELTSDPKNLTFSLGSFTDKNKDKLQVVKEVLELMGPTEIDDNFIGTRWSKLLVNSAFSGMSTVLGATFGEVAKNKKSRKYAQALIKECIDVCKAQNIKLEPIQGKDVAKLMDYNCWLKKKFVFIILPMAIKKHALIKASMLQDIEKGKKCEIEAINGVVSRKGKEFNVKTPVNDKVIEIVKRIEKGELKPSFDNLSLM